MINNKYDDQLPLTEATFYVLISLWNPRHGYGIMQNTEKLTNNRVKLGPGTLYGALSALIKKKWIIPLDQEEQGRRKTYRLTDLGKKIVQAELARLSDMVSHGTQTINS